MGSADLYGPIGLHVCYANLTQRALLREKEYNDFATIGKHLIVKV